MIRASQIPREVVEAAVKAWKKDTQSFRPNAETIAAALSAWPSMRVDDTYRWLSDAAIILPLPQEVSDDA